MVNVSIDWDFFVPEDLNWDLSHREAPFFLDAVWETRFSLVDEIKLSGKERDFWDWLNPMLNIWETEVAVSESHLDITRCIEMLTADKVILFDRHHDCWKRSPGEIERNEIHCGTWANAWLSADKRRKLIWVYPDDLENDFDLRGAYLNAIDDYVRLQMKTIPQRMFSKKYIDGDIGLIHICRSGCWTPPWLDNDFIRFVKEPGWATKVIERDGWNPLVPRWGNNIQAKIKKMYEEKVRYMELLNQLNERRNNGGL